MADKKITIIDHGGQLGNQLWNYASVYAFCLEKGYACENPAFFHYAKFFPHLKCGLIPKYILGSLFGFFPKNRFTLNRMYRRYLELKYGKKKLAQAIRASDSEGNMELFLLPPTENNDARQQQDLVRVEQTGPELLFSGYAFRNPVGMAKYHSQLVKIFQPRANITRAVDALITEARSTAAKLVGVHIRQNDYRTFEGGKYYFSPDQVARMLNDYIAKTGQANTCFIIASDEKIDPSVFAGLNIRFTSGQIMEDLFALSRTDLLIGTNSTFGAFAAFYGNIPMVIFTDQVIDWNHYLNLNYFFFDPQSLAQLTSLVKL